MGSKLKIFIGVVVVVVLAIVAFALLSGDDDDDSKSAGTSTTKSADKDDSKSDSDSDSSDSDEGPALTTIIVKRASGKNASAQAGALIKKPDEIWIRVSAAPKQETRVTWSLACNGGAVSQDNYVITPPHLRELKVPGKATTCAGSVAAQLAKPGATGRVKVALLKNR